MSVRFDISRRTFIATGACALLTLAGCNGKGSAGNTSEEGKTQTVSPEIRDTNEVLMDVPESWTVGTDDNGIAKITPNEFDGIISIGTNVSPLEGFASDEEALAYWKENVDGISGDWKLVSDKQDPAPIYEASVRLSSGKKQRGFLRVAISGEDMIMAEGLCASEDWNTGRDALKKAMSTYRLSDPQAPNYSEPKPKDVFTIVSAKHAADLGCGFWRMDVTVQNNSDEAKKFLGFQIDELDAEGNIIDSYMSYNKNASYAVVKPGQKYTIELTEANEDNIAGMQSSYCEWGDDLSSSTESYYSKPFKQMF